jgi:hypothetical protein
VFRDILHDQYKSSNESKKQRRLASSKPRRVASVGTREASSQAQLKQQKATKDVKAQSTSALLQKRTWSAATGTSLLSRGNSSHRNFEWASQTVASEAAQQRTNLFTPPEPTDNSNMSHALFLEHHRSRTQKTRFAYMYNQRLLVHCCRKYSSK